MKRKIVLDTETTGLRPEDGHRIVEIGAVELIDGKRSGRVYHTYLNPQRSMPDEAFNVHKLSESFLADKPLFKDVVGDFLKFIENSDLLIHNADFDIKFLNSELNIADKGKLWEHINNATCTLKMSKRLFSKERGHKLDDMCKRLGVDNSGRTAHGALLDSELLADCYIRINEIHSAEDIEADLEQTNWTRAPVKRFKNINLPKVTLSEKEEKQHLEFLTRMQEKEKVTPMFSKNASLKP